MKNIKIVDYEHKYAKATAIMWQNSVKGWNGESFLTSEQDVITDEETSIHLNSWLALDGELVVGYCNLMEYQEDTGAMYIGLLNVRDDYHSKKFGKALLLKAIERTLELGWERLDLYTWQGNLKAIPLYKKTGFFWEDRDETTHLMNFIPSVLKNELLKEHFREIDWYEDSIRSLEIKPDGRKENKFDYLTYEWKKEEKHLLAEFCRRGRGLRKIETDNMSITVTVENLKLVFGRKYKIKYEFENKTDKPLLIGIKGISERNIKFDYSEEFAVENSKTIETEFFVDAIEKEQNAWKTYPNVISEIIVNRKKAIFKVGIVPKFPAKISLKKKSEICFKNVVSEMFIDIENCFDEDAIFSFEIPETDCVRFPNRKFKISLKAKEKQSISIKYFLLKGCVYAQEIDVKVVKQNAEIVFKRKLESCFYTHTDMFYGKTLKFHIIANGKYVLGMRHTDYINRIFLWDCLTPGRITMQFPKLGKPFSDEFNKRQYDKVEYSSEGSVSRFVIFYSSVKFKDVIFKIFFELYPNGMLKRWMEFKFIGKKQMQENLEFKYNIGIPFAKTVLHFDGNLVETKSDCMNGAVNWNWEKITEPWLFSKLEKTTFGLVWHKQNPLYFGDWEQIFEIDLGQMKPGEKVSTEPVYFSLNTFRNFQDLREFALQKHLKKERILDSFHFEINKGNPFVNDEILFSIREFKKKSPKGYLEISSKIGIFPKVTGKIDEDKCQEISLKSKITKQAGFDIAELKADLNYLKFSREKAFFPIGEGKVDYSKREDIHSVCNGIITLKSSDKFGPALFSMEFNGNEWLDSSFPKTKAKSWWNPWFGGIYLIPARLNEKALLKEKYRVRFVEKTDVLGNEWKGLNIEFKFRENEEFEGLEVKQYFLLLPEVPLMFSISEISQNTGKYISNESFELACFLKPDEIPENSSFIKNTDNNNEIEVFGGEKQYNVATKESAVFKGNNREEILQIKSFSKNRKNSMYNDTKIISTWMDEKINCKNGGTQFLNPCFFIFTDKKIEDELLVDLENIRFD